MALSRVKTWVSEILTAADLNAEFDNILNNALTLVSPLTANLDANGKTIILDADGDSSIAADTDDRLDFAAGGFDVLRVDGTTASVVNGLVLIGTATGVAPQIEARGEANTGIDFHDSNSAEILILASTASAVNEVTITNKATGAAPTIGSSGESNIGLILLDSNGNEELILASTASAVNEFTITNTATGNAPTFGSSGEADTGWILLDSNGNEILTGAAVGSAVNDLKITNAATGVAPTLQPAGEANIGLAVKDSNDNELLTLISVASAVNEIEVSNTATGVAPILKSAGEANTGLQFQDSNGNETLILATAASAVNQATITASATGADVTIAATGDDTNIDIDIQSKGSGSVLVNGSAIQSGYSLESTKDLTNGGADDLTEVEWTGIAAGTVMMRMPISAGSFSGTDLFEIQLGDSGGYETSGYSGGVDQRAGNTTAWGSAARITAAGAAATIYSGIVEMIHLGSNVWSFSATMAQHGAQPLHISAGTKTLSGELTQVKLMSSGTDTFDGGTATLYSHQ